MKKCGLRKFIGTLNKITASNADCLRSEVIDAKYEGDEVAMCAQMVFNKCVSEPQNCSLYVALVKQTEVGRELGSSFDANEWLNSGDSEDSKKHCLGSFGLLCHLRKQGMLSYQRFHDSLKCLLVAEAADRVVECMKVVKEFKDIISVSVYADLLEQCREIGEVTKSMKIKFLVEDIVAEEKNAKSECSNEKSSQQPGQFPTTAQHHQQQRIPSECTVYFSNLDSGVTECQLAALLRSHGEIIKVRLCGNAAQATVFAFVEYEDAASAKIAILKDGRLLLGQYAVRASHSKSIIQDKSTSDSIFGKWGKARPCTFGFSGREVSQTTLRRAMQQQNL
jgi:hypothetical protein